MNAVEHQKIIKNKILAFLEKEGYTISKLRLNTISKEIIDDNMGINDTLIFDIANMAVGNIRYDMVSISAINCSTYSIAIDKKGDK